MSLSSRERDYRVRGNKRADTRVGPTIKGFKMRKLTPFQEKSKDELKQRLKSLGINIPELKEIISDSSTQWYANEEIFIEASINNLRFWIYEDGANIKAPNLNIHFEAPDYKKEEDMASAFVEKLISLLKKN